MKVSCLVVTQESRWEHFQRACRCFQRQTWPDRELVVAAFGPPAYLERLQRYCRELPAPTRTALTESPVPLGHLRNLSVQAATGEVVCQWDDDDQYHPRRVEIQTQELIDRRADFCLLSDYWHYFAGTDTVYWADCRFNHKGEPWPLPHLQVLPGSLVARRDAMIAYTADPRKEDTRLLLFATIRKCKFAVVQGAGWCYLYVYHGENTWDRRHHEDHCHMRSKVLGGLELDRAVEASKRHDAHFSIAQALSQFDFGPRVPRVAA